MSEAHPDEFLVHDILDGHAEAQQAFNRILDQRRRFQAALTEIATADYRGNEPVDRAIARAALAEVIA